jgi:hypothetical protein
MLNHYNSLKHNQIVDLTVFYLHLQKKCDLKHPPGDEIYRSGTLSMFEVSFVLYIHYNFFKGRNPEILVLDLVGVICVLC